MNRISPEDRYNKLMTRGLVFFGRIAASVTHELNNAIAIINEHSGLLDDLAEGVRQGMPVDDKKLKTIAKKIAAQVDRGKELIKRLNRFAHAADEPLKQSDLDDLLIGIIELSRRLADLKGMQVRFEAASSKIMLTGNPFFVQQAVFTALELFMEAAEKNRLIIVTCGKDETAVWMKLTGASISVADNAASKRADLALLMEQLKGIVEYIDEGHQASIVLKLLL